MRVARVVELRVSLGGGELKEMVQGEAEGSTEAVYRFRNYWPVYTGLEKHMALYHLIMRP